MRSNLRWKILIILAVVGLAAWAVVPPSEQIRLGLDLRGGVHLVLRVQTDDALRLEVETTFERLRQELEGAGVAVEAIEAVSPTQFRVRGVPQVQDAEFRRMADDHTSAVFSRSSAGLQAYNFTMRPNIAASLRDEAVEQARQTIERRVNELGVAEPIVALHGMAGDQILVQLPGVTDVNRAKDIIRSTAMLELKLVEAGPAQSESAAAQMVGVTLPPHLEVLPAVPDVTGEPLYYVVRRIAVVTGRDLRNARPTLDEYNQPAVSFSLNPDGARVFGRVTGENVGRQLAIVLDGRIQSAPRIESRIAGEGRITGSFTTQEAQDLSLVLRSGALPASLTYLEERTVGPSLGADSIRAGVTASIAGMAAVALFMLAYYRLAGVNAIIAVSLNLLILLGFMSYLGAVMTLPGIAGLILTIGIGVDCNVLIFERIKEELATAKSARAAVAAGFDRVFLTILDTHVTSLVAAGFLFQFGTGPIRGFATTLFFGLVANVFTAVFVSRTIFESLLSRRQGATLSI